MVRSPTITSFPHTWESISFLKNTRPFCAALQVLAALIAQNKTLLEVGKLLTLYPQVLINVPVKRRIDIGSNPALLAAVKKAEQALDGNGRVLLRASGTELKFRVMVEGVDGELVNQLATEIAVQVAEQTK